MMLLYRGSVIFRSLLIQSYGSRRFCSDSKVREIESLAFVRTTWYSVRTLNCPSIIRLDDENFLSGPSSVSRSFELFQVASVQTSQQHVQTTFSVRLAMEFLFKIQIWKDSCNRPDDVCSRSDALLHNASRAFNVQLSGLQSSWSGCSKPWYENYVQLKCNRPDARATPSGRGSIQERISANLESRSHSCSPGRHMSIVRTAPRKT
jgi:hypothetical protein